MAIQPGTLAPDFTLKTMTADGLADLTLSANFGKTNTVLLFFPLAFTSVCTTEMCDVSGGLAKYAELGASVIGISVDSPFAQDAWAKKEGITIPLVSDLNKEVTKAYDVVFPVSRALATRRRARRSSSIRRSDRLQRADSDPEGAPEFRENRGSVEGAVIFTRSSPAAARRRVRRAARGRGFRGSGPRDPRAASGASPRR